MTTSVSQERLLPPRFAIERRLGEGANATTYLAHDTRLDRPVVIKAAHGRASHDPAVILRFEREARAIAAVNHPNVVGVYDYGNCEGVLYLVLRYVEGVSLRAHLLNRRRLGPVDAVHVCGQILAGLQAIHDAGLIHRDVKPDNVIVGDDGILRITDFGIAVAQTDIRLTTHGQVWGTPAYMAPEQVLGQPISPATDIYAVGVILFELLSGRLPFASSDSSATVYAHVSKPPPALHDAAPHVAVPPALEAAMRCALAKAPADRYESAAEMAEALERALETAPAASTHETRAIPVDSPTAPLPSPASLLASVATMLAPRAHRRSTRVAVRIVPLVLIGLALAVIGSGAALGFWSDDNKPAPPTATVHASGVLAFSPSTATTAPPTATPTVRASAQPTEARGAIAPMSPSPTERRVPAATATATKPAPTPTRPAAASTKTPSISAKKAKPSKAKTAAPTISAGSSGDASVAAAEFGSSAVSKTFVAADWSGGFVGDQSWYGRPWLAVYGALSAYPRATLTFSLASAPSGPVTLALDGLDDEWPGNVSISIAVNGVTLFAGPSPWESWNNQGHGENANWTTASLAIPAGTLHAGQNQIVVSNTEPAANFGTAPYVLLSGATLRSAAP